MTDSERLTSLERRLSLAEPLLNAVATWAHENEVDSYLKADARTYLAGLSQDAEARGCAYHGGRDMEAACSCPVSPPPKRDAVCEHEWEPGTHSYSDQQRCRRCGQVSPLPPPKRDAETLLHELTDNVGMLPERRRVAEELLAILRAERTAAAEREKCVEEVAARLRDLGIGGNLHPPGISFERAKELRYLASRLTRPGGRQSRIVQGK